MSLRLDRAGGSYLERMAGGLPLRLRLLAAKARTAWAAARISLTGRLVVFIVLAIILALAVAGFVIQTLYGRSVERTFDARLNVYLAVLAGEAVSDEGELTQAGDLGEPRFELPLSGWYWQIRRKRDGELVQASISLFDDILALPEWVEPDELGIRRGWSQAPGDNEWVRMLEREIRLADGSAYSFAVAGNHSEIAVEKASFAITLWTSLGTFALFLFTVLGVGIWYALKPLAELRRELWRVRLGEAERLEGRFTAEIQPLVDDLNALIRSNAEIVERARTHVGNLAHALKTPLSVVLNEARAIGPEPGGKIVEQAELMRERVSHALDRARIAASASVIGAVTGVEDAIAPLLRSMERIHRDKELAIDASIAEGLRFRGERQDFEEIAGNLVDNACKWAEKRVSVTALADAASFDQTFLLLTVEDDGVGLSLSERAEALKRGRRLDETKPGSGLGLSIAAELASIYGGVLTLDQAPMGGLKAIVRLPAI